MDKSILKTTPPHRGLGSGGRGGGGGRGRGREDAGGKVVITKPLIQLYTYDIPWGKPRLKPVYKGVRGSGRLQG